MNKNPNTPKPQEPPAMGERRARWGYGYQDKIVTDRILDLLREELCKGIAAFEGVRLADLDAGRADLRDHMHKANEQYVLKGYKTVLLIDGLDHLLREINLQNPLHHELPIPEEVPNGFLIILSTQPQAIIPGNIAVPIASSMDISQSERKMEVTGLTRPEVHEILEEFTKEATGQERDIICDSCQGNPLILTYLLNLFQTTPKTKVEDVVRRAG